MTACDGSWCLDRDPGCLGAIYVVWGEDGICVYVGITWQSVHKRLVQHERGWLTAGHVVDYSLIDFPTVRDGYTFERALIAALNPTRNRRHKPLPVAEPVPTEPPCCHGTALEHWAHVPTGGAA